MAVSLEFDGWHDYGGAADGIEIPTTLVVGDQSVELLAKRAITTSNEGP